MHNATLPELIPEKMARFVKEFEKLSSYPRTLEGLGLAL